MEPREALAAPSASPHTRAVPYRDPRVAGVERERASARERALADRAAQIAAVRNLLARLRSADPPLDEEEREARARVTRRERSRARLQVALTAVGVAVAVGLASAAAGRALPRSSPGSPTTLAASGDRHARWADLRAELARDARPRIAVGEALAGRGTSEDPWVERLGERGRAGLIVITASWDPRGLLEARAFGASDGPSARSLEPMFAVAVLEDGVPPGVDGASERFVGDPGHTIARRLGVTDLPTSFLVDRDGVVRNVLVGFDRGDSARLVDAVGRLADGAI